MDKYSLSVRVRESLIDPADPGSYTNLFNSRGAGLTEAVESFLFIRRYTLDEIKGKARADWLKAILQALNGTLLDIQYMANHKFVIGELENAERFHGLSDKWKIDFDQLVEFINSLTAAQLYFLMSEVRRFWDPKNPAYGGEQGPSFEKFVEAFEAFD